jgi:hypothetical protein
MEFIEKTTGFDSTSLIGLSVFIIFFLTACYYVRQLTITYGWFTKRSGAITRKSRTIN